MSDKVNKTLLCLGFETDGKGGLLVKFVPIDPRHNDGEKYSPDLHRASLYAANKMKRCHPGIIYSFDFDEEDRIFVNSGKQLDRWKNEENRTEWITQSTAQKAEAERFRRDKKVAGDDPVKRVLKPFRDQYNKTIGRAAKAALLATIITYITGPSDD